MSASPPTSPSPEEVFGFAPKIFESEANHIFETLRAAIPIVQFAVANCDPSQVIWDYAQLDSFGAKLKVCPRMDIYIHELGQNLIDFAKEFKRLRGKAERERDETQIRHAQERESFKEWDEHWCGRHGQLSKLRDKVDDAKTDEDRKAASVALWSAYENVLGNMRKRFLTSLS